MATTIRFALSPYLAAALEPLDPGGGRMQGISLQETQLVGLINWLAELPCAVTLILDDYHLITTLAIHDAVVFLVDHLPDNLHLVLASRADPPLPLPRLRARGHLIELRQNDLCFSAEEAAVFLNDLMGLDLSPDEVAALESRTEGWVAGLQMAALSLEGRGGDPAGRSRSQFIDELTGSHRFIMDYLVEEVLERQTPAVREFLLKTSILDRLTGPLCDAVLKDDGREGQRPTPAGASLGQGILEALDAANLFIVALDDDRTWYRYHRLFADLLQRRLAQTWPDLTAALHRRASLWHQASGFAAAAIEHALAAGDHGRAASLVEVEAEPALMRSEVATFIRWMEALPPEEVQSRPTLVLLHAGALLQAGRSIDRMAVWLMDVEAYRDRLPGPVNALLAYYEMLRGRLPRSAPLAAEALRTLPEDDRLWRQLAALCQSLVQAAAGDREASGRTLDEMVRAGRESGNVLMAAGALMRLALDAIRGARLYEAQAIYRRALELAADGRGGYLPAAGQAFVGLGKLACEWNDLETAERYLEQGIELARDWSSLAVVEGLVGLARLRQAQRDPAAATHAMEEAARLADRTDATDLDDLYVGIYRAQLWVAQGELEAATRWAAERGLAGPDARLEAAPTELPGSLQDRMAKYDQLSLARLLLKRGSPAEALAVLDPLTAGLEARNRRDLALHGQALRALALDALGEDTAAMAAIERALALGAPGHYRRAFLDEGAPMARLLRRAAAPAVDADYVNSILAGFEATGPAADREADVAAIEQPLVEPLTERELEVLRLLRTGLSAPEIAQHLFIAVSTIRTHQKNIYGKLGVHSRWEAVLRAEELGLIGSRIVPGRDS